MHRDFVFWFAEVGRVASEIWTMYCRVVNHTQSVRNLAHNHPHSSQPRTTRRRFRRETYRRFENNDKPRSTGLFMEPKVHIWVSWQRPGSGKREREVLVQLVLRHALLFFRDLALNISSLP